MKKNKFIKGEKVWCHARVSIFGYRPCMCGEIEYKIPSILKFFAGLHIINDYEGDLYCVKMEDGKSIFYSEEVITEINEAIEIAEKCWKINEECNDPSQISAHNNLRYKYQGMKRYIKDCR